jgi:SAM-dependent methyltransferase
MSGFSGEWLALREGADAKARSLALLDQMRLPGTGVLHVIDLGAGTGSNLRFLAPRFAREQMWQLVDADEALLKSVAAPQTQAILSVRTLRADLALELNAVPFDECHLLTASAFFDLVSKDWVETLAQQAARARIPNCLFVLNVDGRIEWSPEDAMDAKIAALFNADMRRDKGFGPALGPDAAQTLGVAFEGAGYEVRIADTPWRLGGEDAGLQRRLLEGYVNAASEQAPELGADISAWAMRRMQYLDDGHSRLLVGHRDVLALRWA